MSLAQVITPNPNIACTPGQCLVYARETFGVAATGNYPKALDNWGKSPSQHRDQNWPALWFPIWFTVKGVPAGHVAVHAPDHSIWSSSSPTAHTPVHHASLADMQKYWGNGSMLGYVGWTENVEDTVVIKEGGSTAGGSKMNRTNAEATVVKAFQFAAGREPTADERSSWIDKLLSDPNYADDLLDDAYNKGITFQYHGHHYDEDIKKAATAHADDADATLAELAAALKKVIQ